MSDPLIPDTSRCLPGDHLTAAGPPPSLSEHHTVEEPEMVHADSGPAGRTCVLPVHHRPDLLRPCADLVNSEWSRSQAARVHSLQKSCPEFPLSLVLLEGGRGSERLLGHARLSLVVGHGRGLFVESVVVAKTERGRGFGRTLMAETECYSKSRGFKRLYLTTHDKQHFYAHLGYVLSTPVQNAGAMSSFVPMETLLRFSRMPIHDTTAQKHTHPVMETQLPHDNIDSAVACPAASPHTGGFTPPPPPPPPSSSSIPPPPLLPQSTEQHMIQTLDQTPYRDARGLPIFWMHKDI